MSNVPYSRLVLRPLPFIWREPDGITRLNLTGFTIQIAEHTLPWPPTIALTDPAQGEFELVQPSVQQAARLKSGRSYGLHVILVNAQGQPADEFRLTLAVL